MAFIKYLYFVVDLIIIFASLFTASWLKFGAGIFQPKAEQISLANTALLFFLVFVFLTVFRFLRLYRSIPQLLEGHNHGGRLILGVLVGHAIIVVILFIVKNRFITERIFIILSISLMVISLLIARLVILPLVLVLLRRTRILRKSTLLIGSGESAIVMLKRLAALPRGYFKVVALLNPRPKDPQLEREAMPADVVYGIDELDTVIRRHKIREIIIALEKEGPSELVTLIRRCQALRLPVNVSSELFAKVQKKLHLDQIDGLPLTRFTKSSSWIRSPMKRIFDAVLSVLFLPLLSPLFLLISIITKLTSPGPVFYISKRVGHREKRFNMIKFRSMPIGLSEIERKEFMTKFIRGEIEPTTPFKLVNDSHVTPFGRFLRKYRVEELPQLLNVLRGEMSLVGPRPITDFEYDEYEEWHKQRFRCRPGIIGIWQAAANSKVSFNEIIALDIFYALSAHFWLDIELIQKALKSVFIDNRAV